MKTRCMHVVLYFFGVMLIFVFQSSAHVSNHGNHCIVNFCVERKCKRNSFFEMEVLDDKILHRSLSEESNFLQNLVTVNH